MIDVSWSEIKRIATSKSIALQWIEKGENYWIALIDGPFSLLTILPKNSSDADTIDFETNFKSVGNPKIEPKDSDNSVIIRTKTTRTGWHYEPRSIDFITSKLGSLYNRKHDGNTIDTGTDYNDCIISFFNSSGTNISNQSQSILDTDCVRTHIDWQPTYEMDIIGATVSVLNPPEGNDRAYCWVIVAPDIPSQYGGSVPFMAGGWNFRHFKNSSTTFLDGRGVKSFAYDPVYNSNKFRVVVKHEAGAKIEVQFVAEHFKA